MRNRHVPRVCRNCQAPMASDEDTCWRCGVAWAAEDEPRATLRLVPAGASSEAGLDTERWINEGGSVAPPGDDAMHFEIYRDNGAQFHWPTGRGRRGQGRGVRRRVRLR